MVTEKRVKSAALFAWVVISEEEKLCWCVVLIFIRRCGAALLHNCTAPPGPGSCAVWGHGGETAAAESPAWGAPTRHSPTHHNSDNWIERHTDRKTEISFLFCHVVNAEFRNCTYIDCALVSDNKIFLDNIFFWLILFQITKLRNGVQHGCTPVGVTSWRSSPAVAVPAVLHQPGQGRPGRTRVQTVESGPSSRVSLQPRPDNNQRTLQQPGVIPPPPPPHPASQHHWQQQCHCH